MKQNLDIASLFGGEELINLALVLKMFAQGTVAVIYFL